LIPQPINIEIPESKDYYIQPDSHPHNKNHDDYSQGTYGVGRWFQYRKPDGTMEPPISYEEAQRRFGQEMEGMS
jgi:hypothetical protein